MTWTAIPARLEALAFEETLFLTHVYFLSDLRLASCIPCGISFVREPDS